MTKKHKVAYWMKLVTRHGAEDTVKALLVIIDELTAMLDLERARRAASEAAMQGAAGGEMSYGWMLCPTPTLTVRRNAVTSTGLLPVSESGDK